MKFLEIFEESVIVLRTNRMRTALSILGIIIGIASVITLMTLGQASQQSTIERIQSLGSNLLIINPGASHSGSFSFLRGSFGGGTTLTYADAIALEESDRVTTINNVTTDYSDRAQISFGRNNSNTSVIGISENYFKIRNIELTLGEEITENYIRSNLKVAILGPTLAQELFGNGVNPLGQDIRINGTSFKVIGVIKEKGEMGRMNFDEGVFIPLTTAQKALFGVNYVSSIYVEAKSADLMDAAENQIGFFLLDRHRLKTPENADFTISSQGDILETVSEVTQTFTTLLSGIAAISLIVGGIGIMNIMLVTVTERTREIGIRKALGAKRKTIITQFLMEAIILTISGGVIGVLLGISLSYILINVMSLPHVIAFHAIGLAVAVSCVIGILFGWYPARKASRLQPIEALRYE